MDILRRQKPSKNKDKKEINNYPRVSYIYSTPMQPAKCTADRMQKPRPQPLSTHPLLFPYAYAVTSIAPMPPPLSPHEPDSLSPNAAQCRR